MSVYVMLCSADTGQGLETLTVRMRGIASTSTGLSSAASTRSSHSILFGESKYEESMSVCCILLPIHLCLYIIVSVL